MAFNATQDGDCKCPVSRHMMSTPDASINQSGARPAPKRPSPEEHERRERTENTTLNLPPPIVSHTFDDSDPTQVSENDDGDTGDDIDDIDPPSEASGYQAQRDRQPIPDSRSESRSDSRGARRQSFTEEAGQRAAEAAGVGAAYALNAARVGAQRGLKVANVGARFAATAAKEAGDRASEYRLLSHQFWKAPIEPINDGPSELTESVNEPGSSGDSVNGHDSGRDVDGMRDACEKAKEYDGKLRNRLLGGINQYLLDTAMLLALSSSLALNTLFHPLEFQPRVYQDKSPDITTTIYVINPNSRTRDQAKWIKFLLSNSMVLSLCALIIGYIALGIVQSFNPWGWAAIGIDENGRPNEAAGLKSDFHDPAYANQSSSLTQKLQLQSRKAQIETLKMRLPLIYMFPRMMQVALLLFLSGFVGLLWFVWVNELGFVRFFKGVLGSSSALPLVAAGIVALSKRAVRT